MSGAALAVAVTALLLSVWLATRDGQNWHDLRRLEQQLSELRQAWLSGDDDD